MILITTAGKIGAEASRVLAQRGASIRVLVRHPERVTALVGPWLHAPEKQRVHAELPDDGPCDR
jgi:NAD(P)-dependent dehydrogenase (short-subunit alcohol dehydrogenase family)